MCNVSTISELAWRRRLSSQSAHHTKLFAGAAFQIHGDAVVRSPASARVQRIGVDSHRLAVVAAAVGVQHRAGSDVRLSNSIVVDTTFYISNPQ